MWILIIYILGGMLLLGLAVLLFLLALASRKSYRCPHCGEKVSTEYLNARRCGMCGAALKREA